MPGASTSGMPYGMSQLLSSMATAAQNSLVEGCPIFIDRLRSNPKLAERIKKMMLEWSQESEQQEEEVPGQKQVDPTWSLLPDLLIVDGGKGQLGVAVEVLSKYSLLGHVPVAGLAKQREELFVPGRRQSIMLPRRSQGLYLLQRIRDEAHRFAITHHRKRRARMGIASQLDAVPGIGPARRKALLKAFGSLRGIRAATEDELTAVPGIGPELAATIKAEL